MASFWPQNREIPKAHKFTNSIATVVSEASTQNVAMAETGGLTLCPVEMVALPAATQSLSKQNTTVVQNRGVHFGLPV